MNIDETAAKISSMEIRGAGKIARAAAQALLLFAINLDEKDPEKFLNALEKAKETLYNTRPTAVSLANALDAVMKGAKSNTVDEIKNGIKSSAERFISNSERAVETIAKICSQRIQDGYTIITHCNSTLAVSAIIKAHEQGKKVRVFATETRPWRQGLITAQALADSGVDVTLIVDSAAGFFMRETDLVIVGADTVTADGTVINKIGTSQVALAASVYNVPVIVCAETYKFSKATLEGKPVEIEERDVAEVVELDKLKGVKVRNPVFDATPPKYISALITELGVHSPHAAYTIIQKMME
jgi:ribose 1,5-bisphosphate isomerase